MMPRGRGRGAPIPASPVNARAAGRGASPLAPATPHSARFESAAVAATPSATPPLPKDGLSALVVRLAAIHVGKDALLPARKDVAKFKAEDVRQKLTAHLEEHQLKKEAEDADGIKVINVISRPANDKVVYFMRLDEEGIANIGATGKPTAYSVPNAALAAQMVARGYTRVYMNNLDGDMHLPPKIVSASAGSGSRDDAPKSMAPPGVVLPTSGVPPAENKEAESAAQQIVREWELHCEVDSSYFSPCHQWSKAERGKAGFKHAQNDNYNQRARVYCYLKESLGGASLADERGLGELKKAAGLWSEEPSESAADDNPERGGKKPKKIPWADRATALAKEAATSLPDDMVDE